jgi:hypothetical protein
VIELVYVSRAIGHFDDQALKTLLEASRADNSKIGITGLLLYDKKGTFIQALEGEETEVMSLFNKIKQDPRHSRVNRISSRPIKDRAFSDWSMGFKLIDNMSLQSIPGFSNAMGDANKLVSLHENDSVAIDLLNYFKNDEHLA